MKPRIILTASLNQKVDPALYDREVFPISRSKTESELSPFFLGPCKGNGLVFQNMENYWQYSKAYYAKLGHVDSAGNILPAFWDWLEAGAANPKAQRYPAGKNAIPSFSVYNRKYKLTYVTARKLMYVPAYAKLAIKTDLYQDLLDDVKAGVRLLIRDYDAYLLPKDWAFHHCINCSQRKLGHGMVLAEMLRHDDLKWIRDITL